MGSFDLVLRGGKIVRPRQGVFQADVAIRDDKIAAIAEPGAELSADSVMDIDGLHVLPGSVDPHAHIGLGGSLSEYDSDTGAAALGGVTTIWYMMMTGGSYLELFDEHAEVARDSVHIDYGYHPTLMTPAHLEEVGEMAEKWGVETFKYYMHFRGDEGKYMGVEGTHDGRLYDIARTVADMGGLLLVHAENPEVVWVLRERLQDAGRDDLQAWNDARPPFVEAEAVERASFFAAELDCDIYFVHMTNGRSLREIRNARYRYPSLNLSAETCPHYLTHSTDSSIGAVGKVNPPLREREDVEAMWGGILDGTINTVGSDHVSRYRQTKEGGIWKASAGFPCAPTTLPVLLSEGYHKRGLSLERIADLISGRSAELTRCKDRKGDVRVGADADLAIVDLEWERTPDSSWLGTFADYTIYEDWPLKGWPRHTMLRGDFVVKDGELVGEPGAGRYVRASEVKARS